MTRPLPLRWACLGAALDGALVLAALALLVPLVAGGEPPWNGLDPHDCAELCERRLTCDPLAKPWVQQPINAATAAAYAVAGGLVARLRPGPWARGLRVAGAGLAGGSALFHASLTRPMQRFDVGGIYAVTAVLLLLAARARWPGRWSQTRVAAWAWLPLATLGYVYKWQLDARTIVPLCAAVIAAIAWQVTRERRHERRLVVAAALAFAGGSALLLLDGRWCAPTWPAWQPHALWHLAGAAAFATIAWVLLAAGDRARAARAAGYSASPSTAAQ
jgi:hypothetical protein